jgi:hypothetical protein
MQMSERQWRFLSLLQRLERGELTVGEVAASLGLSRRQVQRKRKRLAGNGAAGLVHGKKLADIEGLALSRETVRRILREG